MSARMVINTIGWDMTQLGAGLSSHPIRDTTVASVGPYGADHGT